MSNEKTIARLDYELCRDKCIVRIYSPRLCDELNFDWDVAYHFTPGKKVWVQYGDFDSIHKQILNSKKWIGTYE
jgi:hypothetical protein